MSVSLPRRPFLWALALGLALLPALVAPPPARAATCTVTTAANAGAGSLRAAVDRTDDFSGSDCATVDFALPGPQPWTITLASGLFINRDVAISGPGAANLIVRYGGAFSPTGNVITIFGGTVALRGLTLADGRYEDFGGGLRISGTGAPAAVTLAGVAITGNRTSGVGGAGLYASNATLTITDTTIADNVMESTVYDVTRGGGGVLLADTRGNISATLTRVVVRDNQAPLNAGGGIYVSSSTAGRDATLTLVDSSVSGNSARDGGGLVVANSASSGSASATLTNSTVSNNSAFEFGGGIFVTNGNNSGTARATLTNSTVSGNSARRQRRRHICE